MRDSIKAALRSLVVNEPRLSALGDTGELAVRIYKLLLSPEELSCIALYFRSIIPDVCHFAGPETAGAMLVSAMACFDSDCSSPISALMVRKTAKPGRSRIEGPLECDGPETVIIDDVLGTGATILDSARCLRDAGCQISLALVVLERESLGGRSLLAQHGIEVRSIATSKEIGAYSAPQRR